MTLLHLREVANKNSVISERLAMQKEKHKIKVKCLTFSTKKNNIEKCPVKGENNKQ